MSQDKGFIRCGDTDLDITHIEFAQGDLVVWAECWGPKPAYEGRGMIYGADGFPCFMTEDGESNHVSWEKVKRHQRMILPFRVTRPEEA